MKGLSSLLDSRAKIYGSVLLLFLLLTIGMTYPLAFNLSTMVIGRVVDDGFYFIWQLWWFKHALLDLHISPFFNPDIFYPGGYNLAVGNTTLANTLLGLPLTILLGEVTSYNLLLMSTFVLSGFGTYVLVHYLTGHRTASLLSGAAFAFCTYRMLHSGGHLQLMGTQWIPFLFLCLERALREKRLRFSALAGTFYAFSVLSSWYYLFIVGLPMIVYLLHRARPWGEWARNRELPRLLLSFALTAAFWIMPSAIPTLKAQGSTSFTFSFAEVNTYSAGIEDFLAPNPLHPLWGEWSRSAFNPNGEHFLYLGAIPLVLAVVALLWRRRPVDVSFGVLGMTSVILALGTTLHFATRPVLISVPSRFESAYLRALSFLVERSPLPQAFSLSPPDNLVAVPLPALLLYLFLPFFSSMRVLARFGIMAQFAVSVLAGISAARLFQRRKEKTFAASARASRGWWARQTSFLLGLLLLLLILFDFATVPLWHITKVEARPVDRWLAEQDGDFAIMEFPTSWTMFHMYLTRVHGKKISYGHCAFPPRAFLDKMPSLSFPARRA